MLQFPVTSFVARKSPEHIPGHWFTSPDRPETWHSSPGEGLKGPRPRDRVAVAAGTPEALRGRGLWDGTRGTGGSASGMLPRCEQNTVISDMEKNGIDA